MSDKLSEEWQDFRKMLPDNFIEEYNDKINIIERKVEKERQLQQRKKKFNKLFFD